MHRYLHISLIMSTNVWLSLYLQASLYISGFGTLLEVVRSRRLTHLSHRRRLSRKKLGIFSYEQMLILISQFWCWIFFLISCTGGFSEGYLFLLWSQVSELFERCGYAASDLLEALRLKVCNPGRLHVCLSTNSLLWSRAVLSAENSISL